MNIGLTKHPRYHLETLNCQIENVSVELFHETKSHISSHDLLYTPKCIITIRQSIHVTPQVYCSGMFHCS